MITCEQSYLALIRDFHNSCNFSNILYLISGFYGLFALSNKYKPLALLIILVSIVSFIHHSNKSFLNISNITWALLDIILAASSVIIGIILILYLHKKIPPRLLAICLIGLILSIIFFIISEITKSKIGIDDPIISWGGSIIGDDETTCYTHRFQVLYLTYHTIWHLISGLTILLCVITLVPAVKK